MARTREQDRLDTIARRCGVLLVLNGLLSMLALLWWSLSAAVEVARQRGEAERCREEPAAHEATNSHAGGGLR